MVSFQSSAIRQGSARRDSLHVYNELALAHGAELTRLNFRRTGTLDDLDRTRMQMLLELLNSAREAEPISRGLWPVVSDKSIAIFSVVLGILPGLNVKEEDVGSFLERLHATVKAILEGVMPNDQDLDSLQSFLKRYQWYWDQELPRRGC